MKRYIIHHISQMGRAGEILFCPEERSTIMRFTRFWSVFLVAAICISCLCTASAEGGDRAYDISVSISNNDDGGVYRQFTYLRPGAVVELAVSLPRDPGYFSSGEVWIVYDPEQYDVAMDNSACTHSELKEYTVFEEEVPFAKNPDITDRIQLEERFTKDQLERYRATNIMFCVFDVEVPEDGAAIASFLFTVADTEETENVEAPIYLLYAPYYADGHMGYEDAGISGMKYEISDSLAGYFIGTPPEIADPMPTPVPTPTPTSTSTPTPTPTPTPIPTPTPTPTPSTPDAGGGSIGGGESIGGDIAPPPVPEVTEKPEVPKPEITPPPRFIDVPADAFYSGAVEWAVDAGVTTGVGANRFAPDGLCTRAQTVTFLWRAMGSPAPTETVNPFVDVPKGSWYYDAVLWAVENGITMGTSDTTFSPDQTVTRGQTVTFLWRTAEQEAVSGGSTFDDVDVSQYYGPAVLWAVENGITAGTGENMFSPLNDCTRSQIVTFLYRYIMK